MQPQAPPPNYNMATNYGFQGSPHQGGTAYPPQNPAYPPPASGYPPPAGNYPPPPAAAYPPQEGGYPQGYNNPQGGYTQPQGYSQPQGYNNPQGYNAPQQGYGPPASGYGPQQGGGGNRGANRGAGNPPTTGVTVQPKPLEPWEDGSGTGWAGNSFSDRSIRMAFIRKVYLILMCQLLFTTFVVLFFSLHEPTKRWVRQHSWIYWPSYGVFLVTYIVLVCCPSVRRKWPVNFICLTIFTVALTYMAGMISSTYNTQSVAIAMGITAGVSVAISLFACQTKWDFTKCGGVLFAGCIALFLFGLVCMIWYATMGPSRILQCVYGGLAALLFSMFLAYDTQMLIGGKKYELSPEDHVFGALQLYLDIVYIFLILLSLFGSSD